ncbi:MAG: DNA adenine methylase [Sphaerochaetaceae bacterium]
MGSKVALLKYPGSKWSLSEWIISNFPEGYKDMTYLEPFFGSGAVFFNKERSKIETINDLDKRVVTLFRVLRDNPDDLRMQLELTPWSRADYQQSYIDSDDPVEVARLFLVRCWQAIGTKTSDITGWSNMIKPVDTGASRWQRLPEQIASVTDRLRHKNGRIVQIENMDAIELIERYNREYVFIYADPPYVLRTRSNRIYAEEMTNDDHVRLLQALKNHKGPVMISGYDDPIYQNHLEGWHMQQIEARTEMGGKKQECIWTNYLASGHIQLTLD